jgi:hypothetical protein
MQVRALAEAEVDRLAKVWFEGWRDAHERLLPAEVARHRTVESFRDRLHAALPNVRVVGDDGDTVGFHLVKGSSTCTCRRRHGARVLRPP